MKKSPTILLGMLFCCTVAANAQDYSRDSYRSRDDDRDRDEYRSRNDYRSRGDSDRRDYSSRGPGDFVRRLDDNGNGLIEPHELSERSRYFVERAAQRAGLDPNQPIPVEKLSAAFEMGRSDRGWGSSSYGSSPSSPSASNASSPASNSSTSHSPNSASTSAEKKTAPLVPGFGNDPNLPAVPGFGEPLASATTPVSISGGTTSSSSTSSGSSSSGSSSGSSESSDSRIQRYAESLMKQYDTNGNGILEKEEWSKMRGDPERADTNGDGRITLDELQTRLASWGRRDEDDRSRGSSASSGGSSGSSSGGSSSGSSSGGSSPGSSRGGWFSGRSSGSSSSGSSLVNKPPMYRTAIERLPEGLPSFFVRADADGDGQVQMHEFSPTWTDAKAAEFAKYDLNRDGVLTPAECVAVEKKKQ